MQKLGQMIKRVAGSLLDSRNLSDADVLNNAAHADLSALNKLAELLNSDKNNVLNQIEKHPQAPYIIANCLKDWGLSNSEGENTLDSVAKQEFIAANQAILNTDPDNANASHNLAVYSQRSTLNNNSQGFAN